MVNKIIKHEDNIYLVKRVLSESTLEKDAVRIHHMYETDTLLRDKSGKWFCCNLVQDATYSDLELVPTESRQDYFGNSMEIGDNGGLG